MLWLATPTRRSLAIGAAIAIVGESLRLWAAGHLEKSREVTQSGPYRYTRHPLYLGSTLIGIGMAVASHHRDRRGDRRRCIWSLTLTAAMRSEEAHLREKFGDAYDAYAREAGRADGAGVQLEPRASQPRAPHDRGAAGRVRGAGGEDPGPLVPWNRVAKLGSGLEI